MSGNLEKLCRPILACVCDYWQYTRAGNAPDKDLFLRQINLLMAEAKENASKSPVLEREFARMERPLVFFVDYMVKEGGFPFAGEWREMARKYNELSGDEKFFDLLADALDDPDSSDSLELFYTMLGLGFDGIHRNDPAYVERRMKVCASRFSQSKFDVSGEVLTPINPEKRSKSVEKEPSFFRTVRFVMLLCFIFMTVAFGINLSEFLGATKEYRHALASAVENSIPKTMRTNKKNKQFEQIEQSEQSEGSSVSKEAEE
ncbi:MAG: DotU family type IV/VI secretion system protein [Alphaproteobacteria bacterium]|nr:DotU family type IV/VI secretion system protein [Alphaproteobacteria bacterium]MBO4643446.1 DotU family type IV/VI secretion system protein [Alphaproteobacteria bacterium]